MNSNKVLTSKIESGEYFQEAKKWYTIRYLSPRQHFVYTMIFFLIISFAAYVGVDTANFKHSKRLFPFTMYMDDTANYLPRIKKLAKIYESIDISVARYFLEQYVTAREQYISHDLSKENWQKLLNIVKESSSRKVFDQYIKKIDPASNPDSPILKYKMRSSRVINIISVKFDENTERPDHAEVLFSATEQGQEKSNTSYWVADIKFSMSGIQKVMDKNLNLNFIITGYNSYKTNRS